MIPEQRALFEVNKSIDRARYAGIFAREGRVQVSDVLTEASARELRTVLSRHTPWGISWQAGPKGPHHIRASDFGATRKEDLTAMSNALGQALQGPDYAFIYSAYPIVDAYLGKWDPGGPHEILLEHINDEPFLDLVRDICGMPELKKADGQATLYRPGHFLSAHTDSHVADGWRIAYVLNITDGDWRPEWGGYLLFHDDSGNVISGFKPRFNTLNLFAVPQWHSVSLVPNFAPVGRYAITGWFRDR